MSNKNVKAKQVKGKQPSIVGTMTKDVLGGLFSNNRTIQNSARHSWWAALIIALLSIWLPVLPIMTSYGRTHGSDFVGKYDYGFSDELVKCTKALQFEYEDFKVYNKLGAKTEFRVNESKELQMYLNGSTVPTDYFIPNHFEDTTPVAQYISSHDVVEDNVHVTKHQVEFELYYTNDTDYKDNVAPFINYLSTRKYQLGTTTIITDPDSKKDGYAASFLVLTKDSLYAKIYKDNSTVSAGTSLKSNWSRTKSGVNLIDDRLLIVDLEGLPEDLSERYLDQRYIQRVFANWEDVFDEAFRSQRDFNVTFFMGLYLGVYAVLVVLMGLLIFFMTRGKHNMFNYLKFLECNKIAWWASLCPAILALIIGFLMPGLASMIFIILFGLRVMWMSMKQFKPQ